MPTALVTTIGKSLAVSRLLGNLAAPTYLAIGSDGTDANAADTALVTEFARQAGSASVVTTGGGATNNGLRVTTTFTLGGTQTLREIGVLTAASNGVLFARATVNPVSLFSGDLITITLTVGSG